MLYKSSIVKIPNQKICCILVIVSENPQPGTQLETVDKMLSGQISQLITEGDISDKAGSSLLLFNLDNKLLTKRILCAGLSKKSDKDYGKMVENLVEVLRKTKITTISIALDITENHYRTTCMFISLFEQELYEYDTSKTTKKKPLSLKNLIFICDTKKIKTKVDLAIKHGIAISSGVSLARELGNLPANICTPGYLAHKARAMAKNNHMLTANILSEDQMKRHKMGALLSVANGTSEPAKLIVFKYKGNLDKNQRPIVLIGKGITFDSGGITLKKGPAMDEMKFDMCGAASVFGVMDALIKIKPSINVVGIVPSSENLPGGRANKPGDVVKSMSGKTIEILSTDAEGRLILSDALTYAKRFKPKIVIDIATLTGACITALGRHASGLMANNDNLAHELIKAGENSQDGLWRLPLYKEYNELLKSNFADIANIGSREAGAGAIVAGCFLSNFAKDFKWAHIDIAGTAWIKGSKKSATGRPVKLLIQYLLSKSY